MTRRGVTGFIFLPVSRTASDEIRQNDGGLCVKAGHRKFLQRRGPVCALWPQMFPAQVLPDLQGNGLVRQRSISTDLIFCYLLYQDKSSSLRGNERLHKTSNQRSSYKLKIIQHLKTSSSVGFSCKLKPVVEESQ
jgi:hypothetical protein